MAMGLEESLFTAKVGDGARMKSVRKNVSQVLSAKHVTCRRKKAVFVKHSAVLYYGAFHPETAPLHVRGRWRCKPLLAGARQ